MLTKVFLVDTAVRTVRTIAQALIANLGLDSVGAIHSTWHEAVAVAAGSGAMAILTALAGLSGAPVVKDTLPVPAPVQTDA